MEKEGGADNDNNAPVNMEEYARAHHDDSGEAQSMEIESDSSGSEDENLEALNYRHLLIVEKIIGGPPKKFAKKNGATYYNANGKLKNHPQIEKVGIAERLSINYNVDPEECQRVEEFLLTGLRFVPGERVSAVDALQHPWLRQ
jgi:hypothetical protein